MEYKHFKKIAFVEEFLDFLNEVHQYEQEHAWSLVRARGLTSMRYTKNIDLRDRAKNLTREEARDSQIDYLEARNYPYFILTYQFIEKFAYSTGGTLSRAMIASLEPGKEIGEHTDVGKYYARRDRYHLVLKSKGSIMRSGNEETTFREGELWKFDNKAPHSAINNSHERRIHIIFDVLPGYSLKTIIIQNKEKFLALWRYGKILSSHKKKPNHVA